MFAPSKVRLTEPLGKPLIEDVRGAPGLCTPGSVNTSCSASRVANGNSTICRPTMVVETLELSVCRISPPAATTTCSLAPPGSSVVLTVVGWPTSTFTSLTTVCLKPAAEMVTV